MPKEVKWTARLYKPGDEQAIIDLFKEVYGTVRSTEHWKWKFQDNPAGESVIHLGVDQINVDHVVGQYAVIPTPMVLGGLEIHGAQSLDTMTHSAYQRQGMFVDLANTCLENAKEQGLDIVYGFPNENSYHGLVNRLGFEYLGDVSLLSLLSSTSVVLKRFPGLKRLQPLMDLLDRIFIRRKNILQNGYSVKSVSSFGVEYDILWRAVQGGKLFRVVKDARYLNWRYIDFPDYNYCVDAIYDSSGLQGFVVSLIKGGNGYIVDMVTTSSNATSLLLETVIEKFRQQGVGRVLAYLIAPLNERQVYLGLGFREKKSNLKLCVKFLSDDPTRSHLGAEQWYFTFGDSDGI